jgi:hypothetical protein
VSWLISWFIVLLVKIIYNIYMCVATAKLRHDTWCVKFTKCAFAKRRISYLGYTINDEGVSTCPKKIQTVLQWPTPKSVKDLRSFLNLAGYYRKFVKHFGVIARTLNDLLKKNVVFVWTEEHDF